MSELGKWKFPDWLKFAAVIVAGTVSVMVWAETRFITGIVFDHHQASQAIDLAEIVQAQHSALVQDRITAKEFSDLSARLAVVEARQLMVLDALGRREVLLRKNP